MDIVEFPGLWGLKVTVNRVAFHIFNLDVYWYGIIISVGFLAAVLLGIKSSRKHGFEPETILDLVLFAVPAAVILARLYYVVFKWEDFKGNLLLIFNTRLGGLAIYGGIIGALLTALIFARVRRINTFKLLDFGVPYLVLGQAIGRWGNFINQEAFGTNTTLPWGMTSETIKGELMQKQLQGMNVNPELPVHPAFLYESLWDLGIFLFLIWYRKRKKLDGEVLFLYMILYGIGRFCIESIRTDSLYLGSFRISQVLAFIFAVTFGIVFIVRRGKAGAVSLETEETGTSEYGKILKRMAEEDNKENDSSKENDNSGN